MCKNKFSSRICNEIYCIMYHLNVTWSTLRGVVSFCPVFTCKCRLEQVQCATCCQAINSSQYRSYLNMTYSTYISCSAWSNSAVATVHFPRSLNCEKICIITNLAWCMYLFPHRNCPEALQKFIMLTCDIYKPRPRSSKSISMILIILPTTKFGIERLS